MAVVAVAVAVAIAAAVEVSVVAIVIVVVVASVELLMVKKVSPYQLDLLRLVLMVSNQVHSC